MSIRRSGSGNGTGSSTKANNHADASNSASLLGNDEATALNGRHGIVEYHGGGGGDEDEDSDNSSDLDVGHELLNADPLNGDIGYSYIPPLHLSLYPSIYPFIYPSFPLSLHFSFPLSAHRVSIAIP